MMMLALIVAKTAATAITLASRFGGGIFSPALYLGAMTGGAFGIIAASVFLDMASSQGLYAILGMGAVAGAVLGAPISTTMIVFELTGGYALSIALLLTCAMATGINQAIHGHSYFHWQLEMRGLFLQDGPHKHLTAATRVRDFMEPVATEGEPERIDPDKGTPSLTPSDTLETALRLFDSGGHPRLPVVDSRDQTRIIGWARQVRALSVYNRALVAASEEEHR
jgi:CIC family chloride channel protein